MRLLLNRWLGGLLLALLVAVLPVQVRAAQPAVPVDSESDADGAESPEAIVQSSMRFSILKNAQRERDVFDVEEREYVKDNCLFGVPKVDKAVSGPTDYVARKGYVLEHSRADKIPLWVAEHATKAEVSGNLPRENAFAADPKLAGKPRAELTDYRRSGFDRGHMAPAGNQTVDRVLKRETFYLSNMVPQVGPTFNQGIWRELEEKVRQWTIARGETWIISGGMFYDPLEENPATADGLIPYDTIGENQVGVPTHTYKIVMAKNAQGQWESIAFVMANKKYAKPYRLHLYITTIDWIEQRTGINFFPEIISQTSDAKLEERLEATRSRMWE